MGIVDHIYVLDTDDNRFCGLSYFQSKDFGGGEWGEDLYIRHSRIYRRKDREAENQIDDTVQPPILKKTYLLEPFAGSGAYLIYTSNTAIQPVLTLNDIDETGFRWDAVREHYADVEFELRLEAGKIIEIETLKNESREQVREQLLKRGLTVLEDDDRLAIAHFRRAEAVKERTKTEKGRLQ